MLVLPPPGRPVRPSRRRRGASAPRTHVARQRTEGGRDARRRAAGAQSQRPVAISRLLSWRLPCWRLPCWRHASRGWGGPSSHCRRRRPQPRRASGSGKEAPATLGADEPALGLTHLRILGRQRRDWYLAFAFPHWLPREQCRQPAAAADGWRAACDAAATLCTLARDLLLAPQALALHATLLAALLHAYLQCIRRWGDHLVPDAL